MKTNKEMIAQYTNIIADLRAQKAVIEQEISDRLVDRARLILEPFKEGDKVKCELSMGRSKGVRECVIEIDKKSGEVWVRPFIKDGVLSSRRFNVDRFDGDYQKIFSK